MTGPLRCLVTPSSATSCLLFGNGNPSSRSAALPRTHSELVKFALHDSEYETVRDVLYQMYQRCIEGTSSAGDT